LVVAFSFFLRSEISLTLGLSTILWYVFAVPMVIYGVDLNTDYDIGGWMGWHRAGAYSAFSIMIIYYGRNYFLKLVKGSVGIKPPKVEGEEEEPRHINRPAIDIELQSDTSRYSSMALSCSSVTCCDILPL